MVANCCRSMGIVGRQLSSSLPQSSEQGSGYFAVEREQLSNAQILPLKHLPSRPRDVKVQSKMGKDYSPHHRGTPKHGGSRSTPSNAAYYAVLLLSCGVAFISYLDRAIMGVTILPMAAEKGYSKSDEGFISRRGLLSSCKQMPHEELPADQCHDMNIACLHLLLQANAVVCRLVFINYDECVPFFAVLSLLDTHSRTLEVRPSVHLGNA